MVLMNLFVRQQRRKRHREQIYGHGGRGGDGEMYGESNMRTYITTYKIDSQRKFAPCLGELKQGFYIYLKGWDRKGDGRDVRKRGDICIPMADSC